MFDLIFFQSVFVELLGNEMSACDGDFFSRRV